MYSASVPSSKRTASDNHALAEPDEGQRKLVPPTEECLGDRLPLVV